MRLIRSTLFSLSAVLLASVAPLIGWAQSGDSDLVIFGPGSESTQDVLFLPAVAVTDLQLDPPTTDDTIRGRFTLTSHERTPVADLGYSISLIDPATALPINTIAVEEFDVYDQTIVSAGISLDPLGRTVVPFTYTPANVPGGDYRLRIRVQTSNDQELGWADTSVTVGGALDYFTLVPQTVITDRDDELTGPSDPQTGVALAPGSTVQLAYSLTNTGRTALTGTPTVAIQRWGRSGEVVDTQTGRPVTVAAGATADEQLSLTIPTEPTAYLLTLTMENAAGQRISTIGEFRVVVEGSSGRILLARFDEYSLDQAVIATEVVGPADQTSSITATVNVALLDNSEVVAEQTSEPIVLDARGARTGTFVFPLESLLGYPGLRVTLTNQDGTVLDTYEYHAEIEAAPRLPAAGTIQPPSDQLTRQAILIGIGVGAVLGIFIVIWLLRRRGTTPPAAAAGTIAVIMVVALAGVGLVFHPAASQVVGPTATPAAGPGGQYYYWGGNWHFVYAYTNQPLHNNNPADPAERIDPSNVPIQFDLRWAHCDNQATYGGFAVDYLKAGGFQVPTVSDWVPFHDKIVAALQPPYYLEGPPPAAQDYQGNAAAAGDWQVIVADQEFSGVGAGVTTTGSGRVKTKQKSFSGTIQINPDLTDTTLRLTGYRRQTISLGPNIAPLDNWFGIYSHLRLGTEIPLEENLCAPTTQSTQVGETASFTSSNAAVTWLAPGGTPNAGAVGGSFSTSYQNPSNYVVAASLPDTGIENPPIETTERFTFSTPWQIRAFVNSFSEYNEVPTAYHESGALRNDAATAQKICELRGFPTVIARTEGAWSSCGDNHIAYWVESNNNFQVDYPACANNRILETLTCERTVVQDGGVTGGIPVTALTPPYVDVDGDGVLRERDAQLVSASFTGSTPAATGSPWQNQTNPADVDDDGIVTPSDILWVVNTLNEAGEVQLGGWCSVSAEASVGGRLNGPTAGITVPATVRIGDTITATSTSTSGCPWQNPANRYDVDNDAVISPSDTLIIANDLIQNGARVLTGAASGPPYLDVNGDTAVSAADADDVISFLQASIAPTDTLGCGSLTHAWTVTRADTGAAITIPNPSARQISLIADHVGTLQFDLTVTDGLGQSAESTATVQVQETTACSDNTDNDSDGVIDCADPGCWATPGNQASCNPDDDDEQQQCNDAVDNDSDDLIDAADPGCHSDGDAGNPDSYNPNDDDEQDETSNTPQCSDALDNDNDDLIDSADPGCHTDGNPDNPDSYDPFDDDESDDGGGDTNPPFSPGPIRETE